MLEKEYISNIFAASQTSVEAFKATKKTLKVLMNHDKIDGSKIVEEIDNLGEFNLDFTKDIFSILEYLIFVSDKVAVTKTSRLVLSYIQNENSPPIVKMHAIGLLPIFLKSECPDIFVNLVMIGVNKTFEIIQQEITPEIAPLLRFIACGFVNNKITDVETFILPLNQTFLDICVCEDEKSSIIAMESLSMICEKDKSLDFPIEIIMENLISFSVRRIVASINAFSHLIGYYNEGQDKMIFYQIIEVAVKNKEKEIIKAAFNYFIEVIIAYPNDFIPDIEKIIILTFIGRLPYYNSLPFYEYESDDVDIYDLIREMIQNKDEKIICFILKIFPITTDIEKIGSLIVESIKNDLIQRERFNELISMTLDLLKVNSDDIDIVTCLIDILDSLWTASDESLETTPILNTLFDVFNEIIEEENEFTPIPPFVLKLLPKSPPNSLDFDTVHSMLEFISQKEIEWDYPDLVRDLILIYNSNMHSNKFFYLDIALALTSFVTMSNDDLEELGFKQKLIKEAKECLKSLILDNEYVSSNVFDFFSGKPEEKAILNDIINE
ncbi:hypothetical protein TVAG_458930 [Trichomonas vaginalis G3]|uniref:Uncharacterized protein n=2 Tax=Trichomonas vaginalis (strain ATCC PRA-98 / G3) TaxID=412133 RepID=A2E698_TRIV3|nr:hypothetical protein TVAG_458930 [Trichomonas vaginalis G3]|eukprot:XP_001324044.1 hypothetical protein [Trichomonas vaginalis G3]